MSSLVPFLVGIIVTVIAALLGAGELSPLLGMIAAVTTIVILIFKIGTGQDYPV